MNEFDIGLGYNIADRLNVSLPEDEVTIASHIRRAAEGQAVNWDVVEAAALKMCLSNFERNKARLVVKNLRGVKLRFLSNTYDPNREDAQMSYTYSYTAWRDPQARESEWQYHLDWINSHIVGDPKATDAYSVEELKAIGMIGVYAEEKDEAQPDSPDALQA